MTASVRLSRKKAPIKTMGTKKKIVRGEYAFWYMTMISDQPSSVMHWKTLSRAQKMLSKLVTSLFGLSVAFPQ